MVVVVVLPFAEFVVEQVCVIDHDPIEESVELFGVDAVGSFDFAVESWGGGSDLCVGESFVEYVPVEHCLELGTVVCLDRVDFERQPFGDVVDERDCGFLIAAGVDA